MEGSISSGLLEPVDGGVHGLPGGGKCAGGQHLDLLRVSDRAAGIDDSLSGFLQLSSEVSELGYFAFNKGISQLLYSSINDALVGMPGFKDALSKGIEGRMRTVARSCPQFDRKYRVSFTHGEVGTWAGVVKYEPYILGPALVVVGVVDGCRDAESPIGPILNEWWSRMHVAQGVVDDVLVCARYYDRGYRRSDAMC